MRDKDGVPGLEKDEFSELLKQLPENNGIFMVKDPDGSGDFKIWMIKEEDLRKLSEEPNLFHVIYQFSRPGTGYFSNYLEHKYFPPETPANDEFQYRVFKWNGLIWCICSIPLAKKDLAYEAAEISKLRIANGIPLCCGGEGKFMMVAATRKETMPVDLPEDAKAAIKWFPVDCNNAFTLEFERKSDGYEPGGDQDIRIWEDFKLKQLWKECEVPDDPDDPWGNN